MSISTPFIKRPVATSLLTLALAMAGALGFYFLPVAPLPQVEYPTINVFTNLPGASPETMASAVTTPLERTFGRIAGITEMTSNSSTGSGNITMQFDLDRNIDAAARDVQAAINAARGQLPANLPTNPRYRKQNPADQPIVVLALTSGVEERAKMYADPRRRSRQYSGEFASRRACPDQSDIFDEIRYRVGTNPGDAHGGQCESAERPIVGRTTHLANGHHRSTFQGGGVQASDCEFQERRSHTSVGYRDG